MYGSYKTDVKININEIIKKQDDDLDTIYNGVKNMKSTALIIGDEVNKQNKMLDEFNDKVVDTTSNVRHGIRDIQKVDNFRNNSCGCIFLITIVLLCIVIIILLSVPS